MNGLCEGGGEVRTTAVQDSRFPIVDLDILFVTASIFYQCLDGSHQQDDDQRNGRSIWAERRDDRPIGQSSLDTGTPQSSLQASIFV